ncbi:nucleoside recognition protein [bacterium 1XD42-8]|jgi:spore maturation protein A|nr:nucleoside recognition protein [Lachnospiraceae bacterium]RKJ51429.1 nucleoside recognition protein [bacterium 1XD42-8]
MLNYIWGFMIIVGILFGALNGTIPDITDAALNSAKDAVTLCITMTGVMSLWVGLMEIAKNTGLISSITKKIQPFIDFMFPNIPKGHIAREHISTNIIANVLGLGWAATPAGLKAMEALQELNKGRKTASTEMCTFLIINISSLQLIPVNVIAYRSQYGSVNPVGIVGPALLATICSTLAGILFAKIMAVKK